MQTSSIIEHSGFSSFEAVTSSFGENFDIITSNQEVQETQKDIRKLLKIKERADPKIPKVALKVESLVILRGIW